MGETVKTERSPLHAVPATMLFEEQMQLVPRGGGERTRLLRSLIVLADVIAAVIGGGAAAIVAGTSPLAAAALVACCVLAWVGTAFVAGLYALEGLGSWASGIPEISRQAALALLISWPIYGAAALLGAAHPIAAPLVLSPMVLLLASLGRAVARSLLHRLAPLRQRTVIVGTGVVASQINERLGRHSEFGLEAVGLVDDDPHRGIDINLPVLGGLSDLRTIINEHAIERVIIAFSRASHEELLDCLRACREQRVAVDVVPRLFEFLGGAKSLEQIGDVPLLSIGVPRLSRTSKAAKRLLDIAIASVALIALAPVLAMIAIAIKLESRGPVFFRQSRVGQNAVTFELIKFRSMSTDAEETKHTLTALNEHDDAAMFKIHSDPRVTRVGRILRQFSLDEMPQFINVLKGQMSIVGPRPLILPEHAAFVEQWHGRRIDLRPGLTGPWQISGRSDLSGHEMLRLDFQYVTGWSLARDLEIMLATVPAVFSARGAY